MLRLLVTIAAACTLTGCGASETSLRLKALEQRVSELDEQTLKHYKHIAAHESVIMRMQRDEIDRIETHNAVMQERIRKLDGQ